MMDSIALTNPCIQNGWEEWRRGMEDNRERRWRERASHWAEEVNEKNEETDDTEEVEREMESELEAKGFEKDCKKEKGENVDEWEEKKEVKDSKGVKEIKHFDELATEADDGLPVNVVEMEKEKENEVEGKDEETLVTGALVVGGKEEDKETIKWVLKRNEEPPQGMDVKALKEKEGQNEIWMEGKVNKYEVGAEENMVLDTREMQLGQDGQHEVEVDTKEGAEGNKMWENEQDEEEEKENIEWELKMNEEVPHPALLLEEKVEGKEVLDTKEIQVEQEDHHKAQMKIEEKNEDNDLWDEQNEDVDDGNEEHQETEKYINQETRTESGIIQENPQSKSQEDLQTFSMKSMDNKDSDTVGHGNTLCDSEKIKDGEQSVEAQINEQSCSNENPVLQAWTFQERKDSEETVTESQKPQEEEFKGDPTSLQEEYTESTDDEEAAEQSNDEDEDSNDEDLVKNYSKDHYPTDIFQTLTEFKDSSLLTDLTLRTINDESFHVHSPVLAAVSSFIWDHLSRSNRGNDNDTTVGVQGWLVSLGPEVDHVGLEAVVEFAYTGMIACLNEDTVEKIRTAAQALGMPRVLRLCTKEKSVKSGGQKNSAEQRMISLQSINQMWIDGLGCDIILKTRGESIPAHRVILAASSDYFRGMFTSGMRESYESSVALPFPMASDLELLISCSYTGDLPLCWKCIFETTSTALQLQYQPALSLCLKFLQQEINPYYCLDVASFAKAYEMVQLLEVADDFVLRQFQKVARTAKFKDLPAKQLFWYLSSHSLCVPSELVVFKAVMAWIQAKPKRRFKLAKELMKMIHFSLMTFKEFKEVKALNIWSDHSLEELYEAVFQDFCSSDTITQTQCRVYLPKESLVLTGGDQISEDLGSRSISRELWFGNSLRNHIGVKKAMEWRRLGEMPEPARFSHEVAVFKGQLYVFGGKKYYGISDTLNSVYRYDPLQNHWENLAEMQQKRCSFSVVVLDGKIYALGGHCDPDYIDSVEQYCPTANSWSFTWPLDLPLSGLVAKVLQGKIFVSGGQNSDYQSLSSMFLYHPEAGCTYMANMTKPRALHCMEVLGECLYVAGGITTDDNTSVVDQLACEVYSPAADSWTVFASLPVPHVGAGSTVLEGKFYVLGGYSQEDYTDTKTVHRYDPTIQRWENMGKMPGPNNDIRASLLSLPPHLRL